VTAAGERLGVRRVLTSPSLGAFAMITSTRSLPDERTTVSFAEFIDCWGNNIRREEVRCALRAAWARPARVFYFAEKPASEGPLSFGGFDSIFGCLLYGYYSVHNFMSPPRFPLSYSN